MPTHNRIDMKAQLRVWAKELGFAHLAVAGTDLYQSEQRLTQWLQQQFHGDMDFMQKHGTKRTRPAELVEGTISILCVRMDYLPESMQDAEQILQQTNKAYISRYALGRDYHKLIRNRLQKLADKINQHYGDFQYRAFTDSAPVMEKPLAANSGHGWIGKHTNLINRHSGSWFFLGELYTNLPLEPDQATQSHCGSCRACIDVCPTDAIVAPYVLDARKCISYLTIENKDEIPLEYRKAMGNRIYGCDDCQIVCPWNRYAKVTAEPDFQARHNLNDITLVELFNWDEDTFLKRTEGSAIRRIGYNRWLRNLAVALGNAEKSPLILATLQDKRNQVNDLVKQHIDWAIAEQSQN